MDFIFTCWTLKNRPSKKHRHENSETSMRMMQFFRKKPILSSTFVIAQEQYEIFNFRIPWTTLKNISQFVNFFQFFLSCSRPQIFFEFWFLNFNKLFVVSLFSFYSLIQAHKRKSELSRTLFGQVDLFVTCGRPLTVANKIPKNPEKFQRSREKM